MKRIILLVTAFTTLIFSSCKPCYVCEANAAQPEETICKDSPFYDLVKKGEYSDFNGDRRKCIAK